MPVINDWWIYEWGWKAFWKIREFFAVTYRQQLTDMRFFPIGCPFPSILGCLRLYFVAPKNVSNEVTNESRACTNCKCETLNGRFSKNFRGSLILLSWSDECFGQCFPTNISDERVRKLMSSFILTIICDRKTLSMQWTAYKSETNTKVVASHPRR